MPTLRFNNELPCSPDEAWDDLMNPIMLAHVSSPLLKVEWITPIPERWHSGAQATMRLKLFGVIPWGAHEVRFVMVDAANKRYVTDERGANIQSWSHEMRMYLIEGGRSRCEDVIDFEAGKHNGFVTLFGAILYPYRYFSWRRHFVKARNSLSISSMSAQSLQ